MCHPNHPYLLLLHPHPLRPPRLLNPVVDSFLMQVTPTSITITRSEVRIPVRKNTSHQLFLFCKLNRKTVSTSTFTLLFRDLHSMDLVSNRRGFRLSNPFSLAFLSSYSVSHRLCNACTPFRHQEHLFDLSAYFFFVPLPLFLLLSIWLTFFSFIFRWFLRSVSSLSLFFFLKEGERKRPLSDCTSRSLLRTPNA